MLFRLGIVLELGVGSPSQELHSAEGEGKGTGYADSLAARRLKIITGTPLDSRYGRIRKRCIDCELKTHDLRDSNLQAAIYKDIVVELQALESKFAKLDTGHRTRYDMLIALYKCLSVK